MASIGTEDGVLRLRVARPSAKEEGKVEFETVEVDLAQKKSELKNGILTVTGVITPDQLGTYEKAALLLT